MKGRSVVWSGLKAPAGTKSLHEDSDGEKGRELRWRGDTGPHARKPPLSSPSGAPVGGGSRGKRSLCGESHSHGSHLEAIPPHPMPPSDETTALGCNLNRGLSSALLPACPTYFTEKTGLWMRVSRPMLRAQQPPRSGWAR